MTANFVDITTNQHFSCVKKMKTNHLEGVLLGLGNPLLDISVTADEALLKAFGLKENDAVLAEDQHLPLYARLEKDYDVDYLAGGAAQNSMRVAQWLVRGETPGVCVYMGCVGRDERADTLSAKAKEAGVNVQYQVNDQHPTGTCAVLVTKGGACRSLVAHLAAANHFSTDFLHLANNTSIIDKAKFFYISGFFLTVSAESMMYVGAHAAKQNKVMTMNLSAPFLCEFFAAPMMEVMPFVDVLFGNETEAAKFSEVQKFGLKDVREIAVRAAQLPKTNGARGRVVVITQGAENVIVAKDGKILEFPATKLSSDQLVDTNGAGDAFVGGYLSQLVQDKSLSECVRCGIWAATEVIQRSGCTFPKDRAYEPAA